MRARYEALLGIELGDVRLHHDPDRARALGAAAYTTGDHVVSADPQLDGERLGHELVHVAQWRTHRDADATRHGRGRAEANAARIGADVAAGRRRREPLVPPGGALQRDVVPTSVTEVALEDLIASTLSRTVVAGDDDAARRRVDDVTAAMARLDAHDSMVLHGRLMTGEDPLAVRFRERLARATRARLLAQLLRQSARGDEAPPASTPERDYFAGLSLQVPTWTVLMDPLAHPEEDIVIPVHASVPQPDELAPLYADWTVERVSPSGELSEVTYFELPWIPGMTIIPQYTIAWTDVGMHYVTVRFRDDVSDIVHIERGQYFVTTVVPQALDELEGHPQYVDSFTEVNYDPDFRPDQPGHLSYWIGIDSADGWAYIDTRDVSDTGGDASGFHWRDGRIFPAEMNPTTTPGLVEAKRGVAEWMDEYNTMFIIGAFVSGVFPILMQVPASVGPMPSGGGGMTRLRMPRVRTPRVPTPPVPGAPGGGGGGTTRGTMETVVTGETTIVDTSVASALDAAAAGRAVQPGAEALAVSTLGGRPVAATNTVVGELAATGSAGATIPVTRAVTHTAAERAAITAALERAAVGGVRGTGDRAIAAEALLAESAPGVTPVLASTDAGMINGLARLPGSGINPARLGRYQNVAEYLHYTRNGATTFAVTVEGRVLIVRPIQPIRAL